MAQCFEYTDNQLRKALVGLAIEQTLLDIGNPVLEEVTRRLNKEFNCYIPDCHEHPEYLKKILKDLYGASHLTIVESIKTKLQEFTYKQSINKFVEVMVC